MAHFHELSQLNPSITGWYVRVKVLRMFNVYTVHPKGSLGLILADEQGQKVEALINPEGAGHYSNFLEEDQWYTVMNFSVFPNVFPTKATRGPFRISFLPTTVVLNPDQISNYIYSSFTPFVNVLNGKVDRSYLVDLVGYVVEADTLRNDAPEAFDLSGYRFRFSLKDTEGHLLKCLASGGTAVDFSNGYNEALANSGPTVVCVLRWWKVMQILEGSRNVRIYCWWPISKSLFNPDIDEVNRMLELDLNKRAFPGVDAME